MSKKKQTKKQKLTPKQKKFADEYIKTGNATEAYRRAYSAKNMSSTTINSEAAKTLRKPLVKDYIDKLNKKLNSEKTMDEKEIYETLSSIARGEKQPNGQMPKVKDQLKAMDEILKRFMLTSLDKAQIKKAQADAIKSETEAKLAQQQIDDHNTASGAVVDALKDMPKEEIVKLARKVGNERNANNASNAKSETSG